MDWKGMKEVKLELMDWKNIEQEAENQIRNAMITQALSEQARMEAKKQIKSHGGKTSEEERAEAQEEKKKAKKTE